MARHTGRIPEWARRAIGGQGRANGGHVVDLQCGHAQLVALVHRRVPDAGVREPEKVADFVGQHRVQIVVHGVGPFRADHEAGFVAIEFDVRVVDLARIWLKKTVVNASVSAPVFSYGHGPSWKVITF